MKNLTVIVGLGTTGLSVAHYLKQNNIPFAINDTRANPPNLAEIQQHFPNVKISLGKLDETLLDQADQLIVSPGIAITEPAIAKQIKKGKSVIGDIELFAQSARKPIIAITGTNAKSTVTTLVGKMVEGAGIKAGVGGNLGVPALELLNHPADYYVLELSSFQLETTFSLKAEVATILNITPDHMDRHHTLDNYVAAKQRVYQQCRNAVCNRDDALTDYIGNAKKYYFTLQHPAAEQFGLVKKNNETYLALGEKLLLATRELPILGKHYQANALASLAIGHAAGLSFEPMLQVLRKFKGLPHRCQLVRIIDGVYWYNDSKGTNVGATLAAIEGLGSEIEGKIVLIAGGIGKQADFSLLVPAIEKYVKTVVLIGEAAQDIANAIHNRVNVVFAKSMEHAIALSQQSAQQQDSVLLSPACASFDMFKNFEHRGEVFVHLVNQL